MKSNRNEFAFKFLNAAGNCYPYASNYLWKSICDNSEQPLAPQGLGSRPALGDQHGISEQLPLRELLSSLEETCIRAWPSSVWPELSSARWVQGRDPEFREQQIEGNSVPNLMSDHLGFQ